MKEKSKNSLAKFRFWEIAQICISAFFLIVLLAVLSALIYQHLSPTGLYKTEYEGLILDKSATFRESQFGSSVIRKLLIEDKNGFRFEVIVTSDIYERAEIGKLIKSNKFGVEILPAEAILSNSNH